MVLTACGGVIRLARHIHEFKALVLEIILAPEDDSRLVIVYAVESHIFFGKLKEFLIWLFGRVEIVVILISALMKLQVSALDLLLIQADGQFYKPLHVGWVIKRLGSSEVIDSESQFESVISQVDLVGGVERIDYSRLRNDGVWMVDELLKALESESSQNQA